MASLFVLAAFVTSTIFTPTVARAAAPSPSSSSTPAPAPSASSQPSQAPAAARTSLIVELRHGLSSAQQQGVLARDGGTEKFSIPSLHMHIISVPSSAVNAQLSKYKSDPQVTSVEVDHQRKAAATPSDPAYPDQWALPQIGWDTVFGSVNPAGSATIAVLDTGVDASNADLSGIMVPGYSAIAGADPNTDVNGHGTWLASIAAAATDNATGIAGVAYSGVKVMPVKVLDDTGVGQDSDIVNGITWAADHGASVILMGFSNPGFSQALQDAANYAWSKGAVLVAATGNGGSSTVTYPAGDASVVGVSSTDSTDALATGSNYGTDTFLGAPGVDIVADAPGGGTVSVTGTSASAAIVAGSAALLMASDPSASNGVVVGRLARNADPAGTSDQTGNGRVNLARAIADTSTVEVVPAGAPPVGSGGPLVGPYVAAAFKASLQGQSSPACTTPAPCPWESPGLTGWHELDSIPVRVDMTGGPVTASPITVNFDHTQSGGTPGIQDLTGWTTSAGVTMTTPVLTAVGTVWSYTFNVTLTGATGDINFTARLAAGSHQSTGSSLHISGLGTLQIAKPSAVVEAGNPDLAVTKTGPATTTRGANVTYTVSYQNRSTATAQATGVQMIDTLPAGLTSANCSGACSVTGTTVTWDLGSLAVGASGSRTITATVASSTTNGQVLTNSVSVYSAEDDLNLTDNTATLSTTVIVPAAILTGTVYNDLNGNGSFDAGEPGLSGVAVALSGAGTASVVTDANGVYSFTLTAAGTYNLDYTVPSGFANSGTKPLNGIVVTSGQITNPPTTIGGKNFFATQSSGSIGGHVYVDLNGNGLFDTGEPALGGVSISLAGANSASTTTASDGSYSFSGLVPGADTITDTVPTGFANTGSSSIVVTLTSGGSSTGDNFLVRRTTSTAITRTSGPNPSTYGTSLTFTATVTSGAGNPNGEGSVTFTDGATTLCSAVALTGNSAACSTSSLNVASSPHSITATYSGTTTGNGYAGSASAPLSQTVAKALLTITADNKSKLYGAALPRLTATYSGFVNGDSAASLGGALVLSTSATAGSPVGSYAITPSGSTSTNYTISFVNGTLSVTTALLTITAVDKSKVYGAALPTLTVTYSGFVNGDTAASLTTPPAVNTTATAASHVNLPGYPITASGAVDANYAFSYVSGTLSVTTALLTITAVDKSNVYGAPLPTLTVIYSGFVNGDTAASLTTPPAVNTTATAASHVNIAGYPITASGAVDTDYAITYFDGTLTVTPAALTITAVDKSKVYGAALPTLTVTYSGFVNGDSAASLATPPTVTTTAIASSHVLTGGYSITASGAVDTDYTISYIAGTLTVTPAALTVTAVDKTKVYGATLPGLTVTYSGFVNGDTAASLTTPPAVTTTATAASHVNVVGYSITASGAVDTDYTISYVNGTLTVTPAALTISADSTSKVYGAPLPTLTVTYSGLVNGDTALTTPPAVNTTATGASHVLVGGYPIIASGAVDTDYAITYFDGTLTVTPAALTITAADKSKLYGAALPTLTVTYSGFVNGDSAASLSGTLVLSTAATAASPVGSYPITPSGSTSPDYTISFVNGTLSVSRALLTITADNQTKVYGAPLPSLTVTYSGFVNSDTAASLTTPPTVITTATAASHVLVGGYPITASGAVDANYTITYVAGTLTVNPAALTITADDQTKVYGAPLPTLTVTYSGFVNSDTAASLTTPPAVNTTATAASHVNVAGYPIIASGAVDTDYAITYFDGTLTVTSAALTVTADDQTKTYGDANPSFTASYSGFVNSDTAASLSGTLVLSTAATTASPVGSYAITPSGSTSTDYTISFVSGTLTVSRALLTITADNQAKVYGAGLPALTVTYSGFVNSDTAASLSGTLVLSTAATAASPVGSYAITPSGSTSTNYTISFVDGTLSVTPAALTVTADDQTKIYGDLNPSFTASYSGFVNSDTAASLSGTLVLSTAATAASPVGSYVITPSGSTSTNYTISFVDGTLSVTPAALTITADDQTKIYGDLNPSFTASYSGFVNSDTAASLSGTLAFNTAATATSPVGSYAITPSGSTSTNYTISFVDGTLSVTPAALTITADDQTKVYGAPLPTLTVTYSGFVNSDIADSLTTPPTVTTTATAASHVNIAGYPITAAGAVDANYTITYVAGTLTVSPAALTITADSQTKVYGAQLPTLTVTYSGFVNGDTALTTPPAVTTTATASSHVNVAGYPITAAGAVDANYTISYVDGTLTVTPAALTITADDQTKVYGAPLPTLTVTYSGFVNGDTALTTPPAVNTTATAASHVNVAGYSITASGAVDTDYAITYFDGTLSVTPAALTITADDQTKTYGDLNPSFTASYIGFVNSDTAASLSGTLAFNTAATAASPVGTYAITPSGATSTDYTISFVDGTLTVSRALLTITADDHTKVYGAGLPALTVTYSGFVNSDTAASLSGTLVLSTLATAASPVGSYAITPSGSTSTNYTISFVDGTLSVTPAALTIIADNQTKTYGAQLPELTASYAGFVNGDTVASLTTPPALNTTATASSHVNVVGYPITVSGAVDTNYTINYVSGTLSVIPAALTITADDQTNVYGAPLPTLTVTYAGFVNGDSAASLTTQPAVITTATAASHVNVAGYSIIASGAVDTDYAITYFDGTLSVTPAPLTITADDQTKVYGAPLPTLTASYAGFVNGDTAASLTTAPTAITSATAASHVNVTGYSITASGAVDTDYAISYVEGTLTVTPATLTITADNQTKVYGAPLPTLTVSYSGFVNGDTATELTAAPTVITTATAASHVLAGGYSITASGAVDTDYTISYVDGTLTVTPAALTITADDQTKVYGAPLPALSVSYSGFVNLDSVAALTTPPAVTTTATASSHVVGAGYPIIASGAVDTDYALTYFDGTLTVTPAALTITAVDKTKVYGAPLPALTVTYIGLVNADSAASLATPPAVTTTATAASHVNVAGYPITAAGAVDTDYTISYVAGTLTVTPTALTITADDQTKVYGAPLPTLTVTYAGFVNGDTALTTPPTVTTTATASSHVNVAGYPITASGAVDANYTISYVAGTLTVTPAALTITADDQTKVYGAPLPTLTVTYSGFVNGDTVTKLTTAPAVTTTATASSHVLAGGYSITAAGAVDTDYTISYVSGTLTVTPAALTISADNQTKVYGAPLPTLTVTYSGFVNGDTALTTPPAVNTTATAASHVLVGGYPIIASGAVDTDYAITYFDGTLTVTPTALTITAVDKTKVYGAALPTLTVTYSGFVNGDTVTNLTTPPALTTTATAASHFGSYSITASGVVDADYTISYVAGTMSVTPAALTITADNKTKVYGATLPALTASYSGFVNGDTVTNLTTSPALTTTATAASHFGGYSITASGAVDPDYTISYVAGTLSVTPAALTITAVNQTKVYGAALPALTASYSGFVNGDTVTNLTTPPALTTTATAASHVGIYSTTASGAVDADYTISYVAGTLSVTPAALTITADNKTKVYGAPLPGLTASYSGLVNGDTAASLTTPPTVTTIATAASHVTSYSITAGGAVDADYTISYVAGTLSVTPAALTITADSKTKVYGAPLPTLTASYSGLVNGDTTAALTTQPTVTTTATAASHVLACGYLITVSGAVDADYTISYVSGTLTVTPAALTITAVNKSKVYGAPLPSLTVTYSGLVNGDTALTTPPAVTTTATAASHVLTGGYSIAAAGAADTDYTISYVAGTLTVTPAALTISADNKSKVYGAPLPSLTVTYSGLVNGDTALTTPPAVTTTATAASHVNVGGYSITASGAVDTDYAITYFDGTLTVIRAALTITAVDKGKVYGAPLPTLTVTYSGFVNLDTAAVVSGLILSTTATGTSGIGNYPITVTGSTAADYIITQVNGTLTITALQTTVTVPLPATTQYSDPVTLSATVANITAAGVTDTGNVTFSIDGTSVPGGPVLINSSGAASQMVTITQQSGLRSVTATFASNSSNFAGSSGNAPLTVMKEDVTLDYNGDALKMTSSTTTNTATVNLSVAVKEAQDGNLGTQLGTTYVKFTVFKSSDTTMTSPAGSCTAQTTLVLNGTGTAACPLPLSVDNYLVDVQLVTNLYYTAPVTTVAVTVALPGTGFTTGGGWIIDPNLGTKSNFGFTVKYLKNSQIQGNGLYIYRITLAAGNSYGIPAGDYNWIIKSNSMLGLTQSCSTTTKICVAQFTGKSNINAVNRTTGLAYSLGGNKSFEVDITDNGEPGSSASSLPDTYYIKVTDSNGTYYELRGSTTPPTTPPTQLPINGGNLQVHP